MKASHGEPLRRDCCSQTSALATVVTRRAPVPTQRPLAPTRKVQAQTATPLAPTRKVQAQTATPLIMARAAGCMAVKTRRRAPPKALARRLAVTASVGV
eukprot:scaffold1988_cov270-Prasinococcus_capsulatus_cf.AAC.5